MPPDVATVTKRTNELARDAESDPAAGRDAAWAWFQELKRRSLTDQAGADSELNQLFRSGTVPALLSGPTDGLLVTTTTNPLLDPAVKALTSFWMPWQGKRFDAETSSGDNRMSPSSAVAGKVLWPLYRMWKGTDGGKLAFGFKTYQDAGKTDPDRQVMVIDYADVEDNPALVIRSIRDELVEIVPGAYLGKILFRLSGLRGVVRLPLLREPSIERYEKIGYFALRTPVSTR
jgi:hypothetical protein